MTNPNWGMLPAPTNALAMFGVGAQLGREKREQQREDKSQNALAVILGGQRPKPTGTPGIGDGIVATPEQQAESERLRRMFPNAPEFANDVGSPWADLTPRDRVTAMQFQRQQRQDAKDQREQKRADLPLIGRLLEHATDDATYQQSKAIAQQYGVDVSELPPAFDPAWRDQQLATIKLLQDPKAQEALSTAGKQAVDMGYKPGTPEFNAAVRDIWTAGEAKPYVVGGETRLYSPKIGGPGQAIGTPPPEAVAELRQNPGTAAQFDEIFGQGASQRILGQGGPTASQSGGFQR